MYYKNQTADWTIQTYLQVLINPIPPSSQCLQPVEYSRNVDNKGGLYLLTVVANGAVSLLQYSPVVCVEV